MRIDYAGFLALPQKIELVLSFGRLKMIILSSDAFINSVIRQTAQGKSQVAAGQNGRDAPTGVTTGAI